MLNAMAIRDQCHANVSKQTLLLDGVDICQPKWCVCERGLNRSVLEGMNDNSEGLFKDTQWKCKY